MRQTLANPARIRIAILVALFVSVTAAGYLMARASILNESAIRLAMIDHLNSWTGARVTIRGPAQVRYFPRLAVETGKVSIEGISRLPSVKNIQADMMRVRLGLWSLISGVPSVDRVTLVAPKIEAVTRPSDKGDEGPRETSPAFLQAITAAPFDEFALEQGVMTVAGPQISEEFTGLDIKVTMQPLTGAHSSRGVFTWRDQTVTFRYSTSSPTKTANVVAFPVSVSVRSDLLSAGVEGVASVSDGVYINGKMNLQSPNLPSFAKWAGILLPENKTGGQFSASGTFHWTGARIEFDEGTFTLDGNKALGALSLDVAGPRPLIEGTLALQRLDLTQYFESDGKAAAASAPSGQTADAQHVDMDFPVLHHINFDLRISTTELLAGPVVLNQSALSVTLDAGRLAADVAIFDFCGGNATGRLQFDATVPDSEIRLGASLTGVSAQRCIGLFTAASPLAGIADLSADVTSKGRTALQILEGLRGKATLTVSAGQAALDVPRLLAAVKKGPVSGWASARGSNTAFKLLRGNIFLRHNSIYADSVEIDLGTEEITGEGAIDYGKKTLDLRLNHMKRSAEPVVTEQDQKKPETAAADRIVIKGPWSDPTFSLGSAKSSARAAPLSGGPVMARHGNN